MRGADYYATPSFPEALSLTVALRLDETANVASTLTPRQAQAAWSRALGERPVVAVGDLQLARRLVARLTRTVPVVSTLGDEDPISDDATTVIAYPDAVPNPIVSQVEGNGSAIQLFRFSSPPLRDAGVLMVFPEALRFTAERLDALLSPCERPNPLVSLAVLDALAGAEGRLGLAAAQQERLAELRRGLTEAAGLRLASEIPGVLERGVAIHVPEEADPVRFRHLVRAENTLIEPLVTCSGVDERWLLVPVGPYATPEELVHAVLGPVKVAEYLGVRFRADPHRAAAYAALMTEMYGPDHTAYRPIFPVPIMELAPV